jgi:hypothetical protein
MVVMRALSRRFTRGLTVALATCPAVAHAADWSVTTADFHTDSVALRGLSADGVRVSAADGSAERTVPLDRFVSAQRGGPTTPATPPPFTLALAGGDRLVGQPTGVAGERLTWAEPLLGTVPVPFARLMAMGRGATVVVPDEQPKQDVVTLANGDTVTGVFAGVADGKLAVQQADGSTASVPLANVTRVAFATIGGPTTRSTSHAFLVRLADGSAVTAAGLTVDGNAASLTLAGRDAKPVPLRLDDVLAIEQLDGPIGWLSSRTPTDAVQVPYLGGSAPWPARFDAAVDGAPLAFDGQPFARGIGVHAYSRLTFAIEPGWSSFRTQYAIDSRRDAPRLLADVTVRVKLDGKIVHEQPHVRAGVLSPIVRVDLGSARTLTLECDYGPSGDTQAHLNWLQPALLRGGAATRP